jgi:hypothetical protein
MISNPIVELSANSIYIATRTITNPMNQTMMLGGFRWHWALYVTDKGGEATRHDWAKVGLVEKHRSKVINPTRTYSTNNAVLAYLKVSSCSPPDTNKMEEICESVFPGGSKPTVRENRAAGMTCRTWLLRVLKILNEEGFIARENGIEGIEDEVREISAQEEQKLTECSFDISFVGEV